MTEPIYCARCEITLGEGRFKCRRAKDSDLCMDCAFEMDPPVEEENVRGGPIEESPELQGSDERFRARPPAPLNLKRKRE